MSAVIPTGDAAGGAASPRYGSTPTGVQYVPLVADDASTCAAIDLVLFGADGPWSAAAFQSEIESRHNRSFAARLNGELVGYAILAALGSRGDREFEVHTIGVSESHQRLGIGRTLLRQMLDVVDAEGAPVMLDVRTTNMPARTLYESHGFEIVGLRPRYYRPSGADAYLMTRPGRSVSGGAGEGAGAGPGERPTTGPGAAPGVHESRGEVGGS